MTRKYLPALYLTGVLALLVAVSQANYLLFHSLVEVFTITVATAIFIMAWNAREFLGSNCYLLFVGVASAAVAVVDLFHMLAYKGMGVFPAPAGHDQANLATELWIAGRYLQAGSLLASPFFVRAKPRIHLLLLVYAVLTAGLLGAVFEWDGALAAHYPPLARLRALLGWEGFPHCFTEGHELTTFKIVSEYVVIAMMVAAAGLLWTRREYFDRQVLWLVLTWIGFTAVGEVCFTLYVSATGQANLIGHLLRLVGFFFLYKALVEIGLSRPYRLLFYNLKRSETALAALNQTLDARVKERTAELAASQARLRHLATELSHAEQRERRRLAAVLHDGLQQLLAAARMRLALIRRRADGAPLAADLGEVDQILDESIRTSRSLALELSPPVLQERGLAAALGWLADWMREKHGLEVRVRAETEAGALHPDVASFLFQATRELLFNVVKHAGEKTAEVNLGCTADGMLRIAVRDRGPGFDAAVLARPSAAGAAGGFGLASIQQRLEVLGGRLMVEGAPGQGACVTLVAPAGQVEGAPV